MKKRFLGLLLCLCMVVYQEQSAIREGVTAEDVKCLLLGMASGQQTLMSYFRAFIKNFEKRVGVNRVAGSLRAYKYAYMHVEKFLNEKYKLTDIPFTKAYFHHSFPIR